jgi:pimeloyl-ACP methyl ester carboxylesterase
MSKEQRDHLSKKVLDSVVLANEDPNDRRSALQEFFAGWFKGCEFEEICRENVAEYISMHEHGMLLREQSKEGREEVMNLVSRIEEFGDIVFPEGHNSSISVMCPAFEPVNAWYRPLSIYLLINTAKIVLNQVLRAKGFEPHFSGSLRYWFRPAPQDSGRDPIVFLHGISPGLVPYYGFLSHLIADGDRDLFLVELPWVSMRAYTEVPAAKDFVRCLDVMLHDQNVPSACFVGHSYGSVVCSWAVKHCPRIVKSLVLLDPVSLVIVLPHVAANFLHMRSIQSRKNRLSFVKFFFLLLFFYISAREIGIAETLQRNLRWQETNLWVDELPNNTTVVLSSKDAIVPAKKIRNYLNHYNAQLAESLSPRSPEEIKPEGSPEEFKLQLEDADEVSIPSPIKKAPTRDQPVFVVWQDGMPHGGFLFAPTEQAQVVDYIRAKH